MIKNGIELVSGWTLYFDEVSNNTYQVELIDKLGRKASTKDNDLERAIETCLKQ